MLEDRRVLATLFVDDDGAQCATPYTSIQDAIDDAALTAAKDKIIVCDGTYQEQLVITEDDLEVRAKKTLGATILAPAIIDQAGPALVHVDGAEDVEIVGFVITGVVDDDIIDAGIYVGGGGSAEIEKNHITGVLSLDNDTDDVAGILVGNSTTGDTGSAEIKDNKIDNYHKAGIVVDFLGSDAEIENNDIEGAGPIATPFQIGVQVSFGATAKIKKNEISGNETTDLVFGTSAILLFESGKTEVSNNELEDNDIGIEVIDVVAKTKISNNEIEDSADYGIGVTTSINLEITNNTVERSVLDGMFLDAGSNGNTIKNNKFIENGGVGLAIVASDNNKISNNKAEENGLDGFLLDTANNNELKNNTSEENGGAGFALVDSSSNKLSNNKAEENGLDGFLVFSFIDVSASNQLTNNNANENGGAGFAIVDSDLNTLSNNKAEKNGTDGILVTGTSAGNLLNKNNAKKNDQLAVGAFDLHDTTIGGGTAGTANTWTNNKAGTASPAGIKS
jgi:parallel beta-helix repeat protein